jgi:hypothetical protein
MCLWHVQDWCQAPHRYAGAWIQWENATHKHPGDPHPPTGVPVYFSGGKWGHIALSLGGGMCRSTDAGGRGVVADRPLSWFASAWGRPYAGWSEDVGGVIIPGGAPAHRPEPKKEWDEMASKDEIRAVVREEVARFADHLITVPGDKQKRPVYWLLGHTYARVRDR